MHSSRPRYFWSNIEGRTNTSTEKSKTTTTFRPHINTGGAEGEVFGRHTRKKNIHTNGTSISTKFHRRWRQKRARRRNLRRRRWRRWRILTETQRATQTCGHENPKCKQSKPAHQRNMRNHISTFCIYINRNQRQTKRPTVIRGSLCLKVSGLIRTFPAPTMRMPRFGNFGQIPQFDC